MCSGKIHGEYDVTVGTTSSTTVYCVYKCSRYNTIRIASRDLI